MLEPRNIFLILVTTLLAGIAFALIFISCAAMAQERHGGGRGGGWGGGHGDRPGGGYSRPTPTWSARGGGRQYYHDRRPGYSYAPGYGWFNPSAAIGGAVGGWLWRQWAQPEPEPQVGGMAYCINRYKSYDADPRSPTYGTYLGYDGLRHGCP